MCGRDVVRKEIDRVEGVVGGPEAGGDMFLCGGLLFLCGYYFRAVVLGRVDMVGGIEG